MSPWALIKSQLCCNYELFIEASYKAARCSCVVVRLLKQGGMLHIGAGCHVSRYLYETRPLAMYAVGNMVVLYLYIQKWEYLHWYIIQWALNVNEGSMKQLLDPLQSPKAAHHWNIMDVLENTAWSRFPFYPLKNSASHFSQHFYVRVKFSLRASIKSEDQEEFKLFFLSHTFQFYSILHSSSIASLKGVTVHSLGPNCHPALTGLRAFMNANDL